MTAPLSGPELREAVRQLARDLKVMESDVQRLNVVVAPKALWSVRALKSRLDQFRPRYSVCLAGIARQAASPDDLAGTGLAGVIAAEGSAHTAGLISLLNIRDRWNRVDSSLDRATAQALGWLSVWLGALAVLLALLALA